ncbi:MAG TPA: biotin/lipoyl-binding protein [Clostridia bacterium]|jgi:biotin carboxyl carrier protein|nr:biotin/lipoyl-binding protein [Clostridia bacterium]
MKYKITLNNRTYEVEVEFGEAMIVDEYEALAPVKATPTQQAAPTAAASAQAPIKEASAPQTGEGLVNAPIPGTVLKIDKRVGDSVKAGDTIMIIEAMKMENEIVAPIAGTVTDIYVNKGIIVETGAALFKIA